MIFKAAALLSGESSNTFIAMVVTQTSMPAAAARAMQSTARFENLRSILILPRAKTPAGEFGSWTFCRRAAPSSASRFGAAGVDWSGPRGTGRCDDDCLETESCHGQEGEENRQ